MLSERDTCFFAYASEKCTYDFSACRVALCMDNAASGMAAFSAEADAVFEPRVAVGLGISTSSSEIIIKNITLQYCRQQSLFCPLRDYEYDYTYSLGRASIC